MYNLFLKNNNNIYCAAVRKGGKTGLNVKIEDEIYNILTTADQTTKLKYKQNNTIKNILYKTPGIYVYTDGIQKAITFYAGSYQKITPERYIDYFLPTSGVFLSVRTNSSEVYRDTINYYSFNGTDFIQTSLWSTGISNAISQTVTGYLLDVYFHSGEDDGQGGFNYAYCAEERIQGMIWYIYVRAHINNFGEEPTVVSVTEYNTPQDIYWKPGTLRNPVNGWYKIAQNEYSNPETHQIATLPHPGEMLYDPVSQYYYLLTTENDHLWLRRTKDIINGDWAYVEDLCYNPGSYRSIASSDLP